MNRQVLRLAVPNIVSNLSVPLLGVVDTALVGHLGEVYFLGAIAVGGMIFNFIFWGFGFLRMGTTGLTAQAFGEEDDTESMVLLFRALGVALVFGILLILLREVIIDISFRLVDASPEVEEFTRLYFGIRIFTAPAVLALYAVNGWFLGMQNARYPMVVALVLNTLNIAMDVVFIYGFSMNVDGVAWGTLIARYTGLVLAAVLLIYRYRPRISRYVRGRLLELKAMKRFFTVNRDIFIRTLCLIFMFSFFTAKSAEFGNVVLAANAILLQLWMMVSYGIDGFAFAAESLVGKYTGSRNLDKVREAARACFAWGLGIGVSASAFYALGNRVLLLLFTDQKPVIEAAMMFFGWTILGPLVSSFSYIWDGIFIGATETASLRNSMLTATLLVFLPVYLLTVPWLGNHALWLALTLFMIARGVTLMMIAKRSVFHNPG